MNHPMEYSARQDKRIETTKWLCINRDVLLLDGVRFTSDVSNKAGVTLLNNTQALEQLDIESIFSFLDFSVHGNQQRKSKAEKYEILIPKRINIDYIKNI